MGLWASFSTLLTWRYDNEESAPELCVLHDFWLGYLVQHQHHHTILRTPGRFPPSPLLLQLLIKNTKASAIICQLSFKIKWNKSTKTEWMHGDAKQGMISIRRHQLSRNQIYHPFNFSCYHFLCWVWPKQIMWLTMWLSNYKNLQLTTNILTWKLVGYLCRILTLYLRTYLMPSF